MDETLDIALRTMVAAIVFVSVIFTIYYFQKKRDQKHDGQLTMRYDTHEMTIKARNSYIGSQIHVEQVVKGLYTHNPATITYTGNAMWGRVDIEDESLSMNLQKTDAYYLNYQKPGYVKEYEPIFSIVLTDQLVAEASKDEKVAKFLVGNKLVLKGTGTNMTQGELATMEYALKQGTLKADAVAMNIATLSTTTSQLSKEDCQGIKHWLSGY